MRQWDCELRCPLLDWETEIAPLLDKLGIDSIAIDAVTREFIRNPRELALFVELARREGSFNVVTGQALAQRYLDTIVRDDPALANPALANTAMQAIEEMAEVMLNARFPISALVLRRTSCGGCAASASCGIPMMEN